MSSAAQLMSPASSVLTVTNKRMAPTTTDGLDGNRHRHVYGANLGVRADAYLTIGGVPADGAGPWALAPVALRRYPVVAPTAIRARRPAPHAARLRALMVRVVRLVERQSRRPGVSGSLGFVHSLLTKRRAVDFCRLRSSRCRLP